MSSKKVNINRISYGILCVVVGFLFVFYLDAVTFVLLLFTMLAPWISLAIRRYAVRNIAVKLGFKEKIVKQQEAAHLAITLENEGVFPLINVFAKIVISNFYDNEKYEYWVDFNVRGCKEATVELEPTSEVCALLTVECKEIYVMDYLKMYKGKPISVDVQGQCYVFPREMELNLNNALGQNDEEEDEKEVIGEDVSEIVDVREFRPGDRMSRIHWKLSTKCDELMVKEYGPELGSKIVVGIDLWLEEEYEKLDGILVTLYSIGKTMVKNGRLFTLKWYDGYTNSYKERGIDSNYALEEAFKDILSSKPVPSKDMFYNNEKEVNRQKFLYITNKEKLDLFQGDIVGITDREVVLLWV